MGRELSAAGLFVTSAESRGRPGVPGIGPEVSVEVSVDPVGKRLRLLQQRTRCAEIRTFHGVLTTRCRHWMPHSPALQARAFDHSATCPGNRNYTWYNGLSNLTRRLRGRLVEEYAQRPHCDRVWTENLGQLWTDRQMADATHCRWAVLQKTPYSGSGLCRQLWRK